jgi:hypothetical protein
MVGHENLGLAIVVRVHTSQPFWTHLNIIVGGIALNLLGSLRNTADLDIIVKMADSNLAKVVTILKKKGYRVKQPVDPMGIANKKTRQDWIKNKYMKAFNFYKEDELKEVDIIIDTPVTFERAKKNIKYIRSGDITLPVISIDDLIRMKKSTGRPIDKLDMEQLLKIKKLRST